MARVKARAINSNIATIDESGNNSPEIDDKNYFQSVDIKMYPSSRRSDYYDRNARMTSEQNLVSVINRLTSRDSFVIDGLTTKNELDKWYITSGSCNIHGYLFNILHDVMIPNDYNDLKHVGKCIYFRIVTKTSSISATDNTSVSYEELIAEDTNIANNVTPEGVVEDKDTYLKNVTNAPDLLDDVNKGLFTGLQIILADGETSEKPYLTSHFEVINNCTYTYYYLPIALINLDRENNKKVSFDFIQSNDDADYIGESVGRWNTQTISASNIYIKTKADKFNVANEYYNKPQDLAIWLQNNYIIDDGLID